MHMIGVTFFSACHMQSQVDSDDLVRAYVMYRYGPMINLPGDRLITVCHPGARPADRHVRLIDHIMPSQSAERRYHTRETAKCKCN